TRYCSIASTFNPQEHHQQRTVVMEADLVSIQQLMMTTLMML
ncbi:MAG: hypothetical protein ACI90V_014031, partial [Bacillariaceae sp.]